MYYVIMDVHFPLILCLSFCPCCSPAAASVNIGQLEQQLILCLDARRIRQILIELHSMAERPFWRVNNKVRVQRSPQTASTAPIILNVSRDFVRMILT
jgi:hypothetical protein